MFQLRPYQEEAVHRVQDCFSAKKTRCMVVCPTGTGKTAICAELIRRTVESGGRCMVVAHRSELLDQFGTALDRLGITWGIEMADREAQGDFDFGRIDVVLASKDTIQRKRLAKWGRRHFQLLIVDEAHHIIAPSYGSILDHFEGYHLLGVTATPDRGDGEAVSEVLPTLAFEYPLERAILEGYLVRPIFLRPPTSINLTRVRITAGDLNLGDLEEEISRHIEELVNLTKQHMGERQTLAFTPDVTTAVAFADGLRQIGVVAKSVHGESEDRALVADEFRAGLIQAVANCALWTEGMDLPSCAAIAMARKTQSRPLYAQIVGRALRPFPGKANATVIDFGCNSGEHELVHPIDLFDTTKTDAAVLRRARELVDTGAESDAMVAVERAKRVIEEELIARQQHFFTVSVKERTSHYRMIAFDPFEVSSILGVPNRGQANARPISAYLRERLVRFKFNDEHIRSMSAAQAKRLVDELDLRRKRKLATHRQVSALIANGVPVDEARTISFAAASERLDRIFSSLRRTHYYSQRPS